MDTFETFKAGLSSPIENAFSVSPHNTQDLAVTTRAIMVGGSGDVEAVFKGGETVVLSGLQPGVLYPFRLRRIRAAQTTATAIVGLY